MAKKNLLGFVNLFSVTCRAAVRCEVIVEMDECEIPTVLMVAEKPSIASGLVLSRVVLCRLLLSLRHTCVFLSCLV